MMKLFITTMNPMLIPPITGLLPGSASISGGDRSGTVLLIIFTAPIGADGGGIPIGIPTGLPGTPGTRFTRVIPATPATQVIPATLNMGMCRRPCPNIRWEVGIRRPRRPRNEISGTAEAAILPH